MQLPNPYPVQSRQQLLDNINYVLSVPDRGELLDISWLKEVAYSTAFFLGSEIDIIKNKTNFGLSPDLPSIAALTYIQFLGNDFTQCKSQASAVLNSIKQGLSPFIFNNSNFDCPEFPAKMLNEYFWVVENYYRTGAFLSWRNFNQTHYISLPAITNSAVKLCIADLLKVFRMKISSAENLYNWNTSTQDGKDQVAADIANQITQAQNFINA